MNSNEGKRGTGRFFLKQAVLLVITIALVVFFTIPLVRAVKGALNPAELQANAKQAKQEVDGLQNKLDVTRSKMLMGAGDEEAQEKLKKQVEELKRQVEFKELENKYLQNQMVLAQTIAELAKLKSAQAPTPVADTGQKSDKPVDSGQKTDKPVETAQKDDKPAATAQKPDKLMETAEKVDKLVTDTGQKVDKLVTTGKNMTELVIKIFGSLGSLFTGTTFVLSWWRKKRQPPEPVKA
jgi:hypothetical protein